MGFTVKKGSEKGLRRGSEKGVSRRCLERPLVEYAPLGVRPRQEGSPMSGSKFAQNGRFWNQAGKANKRSNDARKIFGNKSWQAQGHFSHFL